ncbi:porin [Burkholderia sp. SG-MS1]|uniref:porin n=1 Tax=Paraburkholderia sp. SG-MS1 TaxID=2023741 RepID=UPI001445A4DF|nr:porin [Paraburkholderia sp. SG-MS1]NKJ50699.1 porin [Paraburkholderia sp. SG-MS1]
MKRPLALSVAIAIAPITSAYAQSSVTLYGILDLGVNYVSNAQFTSPGSPRGRDGGHAYTMSSSVLQGSRWGLTGAEDLGGGYKAIFKIERGFDVTNGRLQQGGTMFGRQAFVGISTPIGRITLGRQYDATYDVIAPLGGDFAHGGFALHPGDIANANGTYRINNAIKFTSNRYDGFQVIGMYALGGVAGHFKRNSIYSVGASYSISSVDLAVGYLRADNPNQSLYGNMTNSSPTANNLTAFTGVQGNPIIGGFASATTFQAVDAAAQYAFGSALLCINYSNIGFKDLNNPASGTLSMTNPLSYRGTATFNNYAVYGVYTVTPSVSLSAAYDFLTGGSVDGKPRARYQLFSLGADYFLSKRSDIYVTGSFMKAAGTDSTGQPAVAFVFTNTPSNTHNQLALRIGLRHKF